MLKRSYLLGVTMCICLFVPRIFAQSGLPGPSAEGWQVRLTPYLWSPGLKGRVGIGNRSADIDASSASLLGELNFGFMAAFEADRDRFATVTDLVYVNLSEKHLTPGPLFSDADAIQKPFILTSEAGYRIVGEQSSFVDVLGGIRFWRVKGELKFEPVILNGIELSKSRNWLDGVFGLKGRIRLTPVWYLSGYGDIGGGGSNLTYQIVGTAGADMGSRYGLVFGYRYLNVAYDKDLFLFDVGMGGPLFGFVFKF